MNVLVCDSEHARNWDAFVAGHPGAQHYQLFGWKQVIERAYRHRCFYLAAFEGDKINGVLPLAEVKSRIFGHSLTSLPFLDTAGVAAAAEPGRQALLARAIELAEELRVDYLELRQPGRLDGDYRLDTRKESLTLALPATTDELWAGLPSERRNRVRKARKAGLTVEVGDHSALPRFYHVWSRNMRDLGSPAHSFDFFEEVLQTFAGSSDVFLVNMEGKPIGAAIGLTFGGALAVPWVSSLRSAFALHPNDVLYWEAMELATKRGLGVFDFGRSSRDSGNHTYKMRWGAKAEPIYWHYRAVVDANAGVPTEESAKFRMAVALWKRLPIGLANRLGPLVRKGITV